MNFKMNKRGADIPSILFALVSLFVVGIMLVVFSHLFSQVYSGLNDAVGIGSTINSSIANNTLTEVIRYENSMWDYFFLAIAIGYLLMMIILGFSTQANPVFYFLFIIMGMLGLFVGVALSNTWESFAGTGELSSTIARFPITNSIMDNFFPLYIVVMLISSGIILFGKRVIGGLEG